tara:strand:+ start:609 stop:764 length:156 start_codon:yes stop_codon:yes gene_type:complete
MYKLMIVPNNASTAFLKFLSSLLEIIKGLPEAKVKIVVRDKKNPGLAGVLY